MHRLTEIIRNATAAIAAPYFRFPIAGADPIYRERVYCYELYHQMRLRWGDEHRYLLNGEVDKNRHPHWIDHRLEASKPDLLVHGPGDHALNHAIIEVKPSPVKAKALRKDLNTLSVFRRTPISYQRAIYLIYGDQCERVLERLGHACPRVVQLQQIEVWLHRVPGESAEWVTTVLPGNY